MKSKIFISIFGFIFLICSLLFADGRTDVVINKSSGLKLFSLGNELTFDRDNVYINEKVISGAEAYRAAFDPPSIGEVYRSITNDLVYLILTNALISQSRADERYEELYRYVVNITNNLDYLLKASEGYIDSTDKYPIFDFDLNLSVPGMYSVTNEYEELEVHINDSILVPILDYNNFEIKAITNNVEVYRASLTNRINNSLLVWRLYPENLGVDGDWVYYSSTKDFSHSDEIPVKVKVLIDVDNLSTNDWCIKSNNNLEWYINRLPRSNESNWIKVKPSIWSTINTIEN